MFAGKKSSRDKNGCLMNHDSTLLHNNSKFARTNSFKTILVHALK